MNQIERIQKRALQLLCNDLENNYSQLLDKAKENTMSIVRLRCLCRSSPSEVLLGKGVLKICIKFTGERPCRSEISIKLQSNFIEIALRHGCSPVNLMHIFRTPFRKNTSGWLHLSLFRNIQDNKSSSFSFYD